MPTRAPTFFLLFIAAIVSYGACKILGLELHIFIAILSLLVTIFWFSQDTIDRSIAKLLQRHNSLPTLAKSQFNTAVEALQDCESINAINTEIMQTLEKIFGFNRIEIYYPEYWRNQVNDYQAIPTAYQEELGQRIIDSHAKQKIYVDIIATHTCQDRLIKDFLRVAGASALFVFYHQKQFLCVIQVNGNPYWSHNSSLSESLAHYLRLTMQRMVYLQTNLQKDTENQALHRQLLQALAGNIAHEIRNPLNILSMILQVVQRQISRLATEKKTISNENLITEITEAIEDGHNTINRSKVIIDIILNNIRSNIKTDHFLTLSIKACTEKALLEYAYQDDERCQISTKLDDDFAFLGDESLFVFTIYNLLKNALYYLSNYPDIKIRIYAEKGPKYNSLYFTDTGPGIAPEYIPNLFDDFYSVGKKNGAGLGLPFCKRTMQAFGGDIRCDSVVNKYTRFTLTFPKLEAGSV